MLAVFNPKTRHLERVSALPESASRPGWLHVHGPTEGGIAQLAARGVPASFISHALDSDEVSRIDREGAVTLVIVRAPLRQPHDSELPYRSEAIGVLLLMQGWIVTVCRSETDLLDEFARTAAPNPGQPLCFLLRLVMHVGERFLADVRAINQVVNTLETKLRESLANAEVLELLKYQKGLVHFTTALVSNRIMLERLSRHSHIELGPEDKELHEDAMVEIQQAIEMAGVSADILSNMMDAFASIISNNLNVVMKVLTAATLVLTGPMLVVSAYGMNVDLPGQRHPLAFSGLLIGALLLAGVVTLVLWRRRWL